MPENDGAIPSLETEAEGVIKTLEGEVDDLMLRVEKLRKYEQQAREEAQRAQIEVVRKRGAIEGIRKVFPPRILQMEKA